MSAELDALLALSADYEPMTASLSPDTLAVLFYANSYLSARENWLNPFVTTDEVTDADWDVIQAIVDGAMKELMTNMIGQVMTFANSTFPPNILACDGATYNRVDYPDLYAVLDSAFIIDANTFSVPDLRERVAIGNSSTFNTGDTGGEATHVLTEAELPAHSHTASGTNVVDTGHLHTAEVSTPTIITIGAGAPAPSALPGVGTTGVASANLVVTDPAISSTGGDEAHNNMPPYLVLKKGIVAK